MSKWLPLWLLLLAGAVPARAGELQLPADLPAMQVGGAGASRSFRFLAPEKILRFTASGPEEYRLRLCEPVAGQQAALPLDVTVVRDQREQGTVRVSVDPQASLPVHGQGDWHCSPPVVLTITVPAGRHHYVMIVSGSRLGVLLQPARRVSRQEHQVVATPMADRQVEVPAAKRPPVKRGRKPRHRQLEVPPPEILEVLEMAAPARTPPRTYVLRTSHSRFGPATRVAAVLASVLLGSSLVMSISGGAVMQQARAEPVQVEAGRLYGRARRALDAAAVLGGLAGAAAITTAVLALVLEPGGASYNSVLVRF